MRSGAQPLLQVVGNTVTVRLRPGKEHWGTPLSLTSLNDDDATSLISYCVIALALL